MELLVIINVIVTIAVAILLRRQTTLTNHWKRIAEEASQINTDLVKVANGLARHAAKAKREAARSYRLLD